MFRRTKAAESAEELADRTAEQLELRGKLDDVTQASLTREQELANALRSSEAELARLAKPREQESAHRSDPSQPRPNEEAHLAKEPDGPLSSRPLQPVATVQATKPLQSTPEYEAFGRSQMSSSQLKIPDAHIESFLSSSGWPTELRSGLEATPTRQNDENRTSAVAMNVFPSSRSISHLASKTSNASEVAMRLALSNLDTQLQSLHRDIDSAKHQLGTST